MKTLVILAAYNGEKHIKEQIESILVQKDVLLDIMVFDDKSKDSTVAVIESFNQVHNISLIKNKIGTRTAANNFFNAIKEITIEKFQDYDWIALSDQDDIWLPNKLKVSIERLQTDNSSLYCSNLIMWDEAENSQTIINKSHPQKKYDYLFEGGSAGCTYVFRTDFCLELKKQILKTDYLNWKFFSHDWFIYFFARANNYKVSIDSNANILYRIHASNLHGHLNKGSFAASLKRLKIIQAGWYHEHIKGFSQLLVHKPIERKIYKLYTKNYFTRLFVILRYNFNLNRSLKKNIQFFVISAIPLLKRIS